MKKQIITKYCIICNLKFEVHPKVGARQIACRKSTCQMKRKKLSQDNWKSNNPDYYKDRYPNLKDKILVNQKLKMKTKVTTLTIQDELNNNALKATIKLQLYKTS